MDRCQRRFKFMGDVGDKIATHVLESVDFRYIMEYDDHPGFTGSGNGGCT